MKKRLIVGLLSAGLLVTMLPGVTVAKDDGKADCKKGDWTERVREDQTAFADQAECVAYVAEGGTLVLPGPTFQSVCLDQSGVYWSPFVLASVTYSEGCDWAGPLLESTLLGYVWVVTPYCSGVATYDVWAEPWGNAWVGCQWP